MSTQVEKTTTFEPSQESIDMMKKQIEISSEKAKELLIKFKGDIMDAVCSAMGDDVEEKQEDEEINISDNHIDPVKRIQQFRNILNEKDKIFTEYIKKDHEKDMESLHNIGYIAFTPTTKEFIKDTTKMTLKSFVEFMAKPFIETGDVETINPITFQQIQEDPNLLGPKPIKEEDLDELEKQTDDNNQEPTKEVKEATPDELKELTKSDNEHITIEIDDSCDKEESENSNIECNLEKIEKPESTKSVDKGKESIKKQLSKYFEEKLEIKPLTGKADKMVRKWLCNDACIIYKESQIKNANVLGVIESKLESTEMNILATKIMNKADILKSGQYYSGNVVIVDKWFQYQQSATEEV